MLSDTEWAKTLARAEQADAAALVALHAQGAVTPVPLPHRITPEVEMVHVRRAQPGPRHARRALGRQRARCSWATSR